MVRRYARNSKKWHGNVISILLCSRDTKENRMLSLHVLREMNSPLNLEKVISLFSAPKLFQQKRIKKRDRNLNEGLTCWAQIYLIIFISLDMVHARICVA